MNRKVNISIPKPCHENWEAMTPEDKGRFCSVCTKTVFDFTKASDKEIIEQLNKDATTCGRFYNNQLNRNLVVSQQKSSYWSIATATIIGFLGLGNEVAYSQVKQDTIQTEPKEDLILGKVYIPQKRIITGVVSDELGPVAGVNVVVKGSDNSTITNFDGKFEIPINENDTLVFTYMNIKIQEIDVKNKNNITVTTSLQEHISIGIVITSNKKRTFFGRQIQKIRNWFR